MDASFTRDRGRKVSKLGGGSTSRPRLRRNSSRRRCRSPRNAAICAVHAIVPDSSGNLTATVPRLRPVETRRKCRAPGTALLSAMPPRVRKGANIAQESGDISREVGERGACHEPEKLHSGILYVVPLSRAEEISDTVPASCA